jgi:choline dehydrogenase-like flavoprotein
MTVLHNPWDDHSLAQFRLKPDLKLADCPRCICSSAAFDYGESQVLAARLTEDASRSVLLLEAGPTFRPSEAPQSVRDASNLAPDPELLWDDNAARPPNAPFELRARVLGGGSSINATNFSRALPSDFTRWTARGLAGWSYEEVLPYYKKMETLGATESPPIVIAADKEMFGLVAV